MITYGWITGESVLACFLSTVIPAFLLMFLLSVINIRDARRFDTGTIVEADAPKKSKAKLWVSDVYKRQLEAPCPRTASCICCIAF